MFRIRLTRIARDLTAEAVATAIGIHRTEYTKIERGRVNANATERKLLAKFFDLPEDRLFDHVDESSVLKPGEEARMAAREGEE